MGGGGWSCCGVCGGGLREGVVSADGGCGEFVCAELSVVRGVGDDVVVSFVLVGAF